MTQQEIKKLRQKINKDWGKKCKDFCWRCVVCQMHFAVDIIEDNYDFIDEKRRCPH